ncbi:MAG: hypothetical protein DIU73_008285 [Actinomycetes bacterium]
MEFRPIKSWAYPGALLDALVDTRKVVSSVELPLPTGGEQRARQIMQQMLEQLDHHLIPRVRQEASPAIVVVGGSTGAGKSTVVNALLGEQLTPSGVLRPTTKVPHLFHHPLDAGVLTEIEQRARVQPSEAVPRGLAIVDSPDLDSVRGENREIAQQLLEAADLWIFVTTAARYGDAVPWQALREGAERGASIAIVLNRVTPDVAAQVRRELVARLAKEQLDSLPLFVIPEDAEGQGTVPRDVVAGLGRWLDSVAASSAQTIIERTLHGSAEALKEWLEELAESMDDQAAAAKEVRSEVRRCAAQAEVEGGDDWYKPIAVGPVSARWAAATTEGGALFRLSQSLWVRRRGAREERDAVLREIRADLIDGVEAALSAAAADAADRMIEALTDDEGGVGPWLAAQRDPRDARTARDRRSADAVRTWLDRCQEIVLAVPGAEEGARIVGEDGLATALASAALGVEEARVALGVLVKPTLGEEIAAARAELTAARRYVIHREALDMMKPTDQVALLPDASSKVRLRRAELRALL